jgi:fermentation-respiration switch protein FrsA (DUF1100 family)
MVESSVVFHSQGVPLVGRFFLPAGVPDSPQPIVIVMGSWLTVKEQMATTYARRLAQAGTVAFAFDFSGFGESHGEPRQAEMPARKIADIAAAVAYLQTVSFVDPDRIAALSICASAQYTLAAAAAGVPLRSIVTVAGWFHDPVSVAPFYGGAEGVARRLDRARQAMDRYAATRDVLMAPAYADGDERAGMHFRLDYYANADRGAVPAWRNEMAEMTWWYWLTFDGLASATHVTTPVMFVHADGCVFPDHVRRMHDAVRGAKELVWSEGNQIDFYDQPRQVEVATDAALHWFRESMRS